MSTILNASQTNVSANAGDNIQVAVDNVPKSIVQLSGSGIEVYEITLGSGISSIEDNCFRGIKTLETVTGGISCESIGAGAFEGCTSLSMCEMVCAKGSPIKFIGEKAFANTNLRRVDIDLYGDTYSGGIEREAFASCYNLTSVATNRSSMIPPWGFKDCTSLVDVKLPNATSYVYDGCFAGCTALNTFTFPPRIWGIGAHMFEGCAGLSSVVIQDTDNNPSIMRTVGDAAFNGCPQLTSVTLPRSISSLTQLEPRCLSGSNVSVLNMPGLDDEVIQAGKETVVSEFIDRDGYITNFENAEKAFLDAQKRGIPVVVMTNKVPPWQYPSSCGFCQRLYRYLNSDYWKEFMKDHADTCYFIHGDDASGRLFNVITYKYAKNDVFPDFYSGRKYYEYNEGVSNLKYAKMTLYWKKPDEEKPLIINIWLGYKKPIDTDRSVAPDTIFKPLLDDAQTQINTQPSSVTRNLTKLGSPLDFIQIVSKSGTFYKVKNDTNPAEQYVPPEPDTETTYDFLPGTWYGRASALKDFVDENHLPCFVEVSDAGCTPCKEFRQTIYNNPDFQKWVQDSGYYFCRVETQTHSEYADVASDAYFIYNTWAKKTSMTIPLFVYYWNKPDGTIIWEIDSFHDKKMTYLELEQAIDSAFSGYNAE